MSQLPPPPPATTPAKSGLPIWGWIAIGCAGLMFLGFLAFGVLGWFAVNKAKEVAEEFQDNPGKAAAEMVARVNPDLEVVGTDDDAGTITIEQKSTGKVTTFRYEDLAEGKLSFETDEGSFEIDASEAGDEGVVRVRTDEGETTFGGGGAIPDWVPRYPGATNESQVFHQGTPDAVTGAGAFEVAESAQAVHEWYEARLEEEGYELTNTTTIGSGDQWMGIVAGTTEGGQRSVTVTATTKEGRTQVAIQYQEKR